MTLRRGRFAALPCLYLFWWMSGYQRNMIHLVLINACRPVSLINE
jgi:hypothetical protein